MADQKDDPRLSEITASMMARVRSSFRAEHPDEELSDDFIDRMWMLGFQALANWPGYVDRLKDLVSETKLLEGDQAATSAARIVQGVITALDNGDAETLDEWEKTTLRYMKGHPARYADWKLHVRPYRGREIVAAETARRMEQLLETPNSLSAREVGVLVVAALQASLVLPEAPDDAAERVAEWYAKHSADARKIDSEALVVFALEVSGVKNPRDWFRSAK